MRSVPGQLALLLVVAACDAGDAPEPLLVDPADTTRVAVVRDLGKLVSARLLEGAEVEAVTEVRLLCWEVRALPDRPAPSDLALISAKFSSAGEPGFALGQMFRHREGSSVSWQWYLVRDPGWLELRLYTAPPSEDEVTAFMVHWDLLAEGENGRLLGGLCDEAEWQAALGRPAPSYPPGTVPPDQL